MGKIYDALKRAEQEAQINKKVPQSPDRETLPDAGRSPDTESIVITTTKDPQSNSGRTKLVKSEKKITSSLKLIPEETASLKIKSGRFTTLSLFKRKKETDYLGSNERPLFFSEPESLAAEQYRTLKTRIITFCKDNNLRTILVTSSLPNEGKSTVASNLALSIANSINEHALLVDCDLRRPSLQRFFNFNNNLGLSNYLVDNLPIPKLFFKTANDKLTVVTAGTVMPNPAELISSDKMINLLAEFKARYRDRFIILDSTPAYHTPEPSILAKMVDCIILVVRADSTSREVIQKTVDSLVKNKIIGVVFNMAQDQLNSYSYNNYYYSQRQ